QARPGQGLADGLRDGRQGADGADAGAPGPDRRAAGRALGGRPGRGAVPRAQPAAADDPAGDDVIGYLRGNVVRATGEQVVVEAGGVGYLLSIPATARERVGVGGQVELH